MFLVVGVPMTLVTAVYAYATYVYARGDIAQQKGRYDDAVRHFTRAATGRNPMGRGVAYAGLARTYVKMGDPDAALTALREAAQRTRTPSVVLAIYQIFADAAQHPALKADRAEVLAEAERLATATGIAAPMKAVILGQISGAAYRVGRPADALRIAQKALALDALNPTALFTAGWLDLAFGRAAEAQERFTALANVNTKDQRPLGTYGLGVGAFYEGRLGDAEEMFTKAAETGGLVLEPFAQARLAMTRALTGKDAYAPLKKAEAAAETLLGKGMLRSDTGLRWLLDMARAYADGNAKAAATAAEAAPGEERAEALALAKIADTQRPVPGWL